VGVGVLVPLPAEVVVAGLEDVVVVMGFEVVVEPVVMDSEEVVVIVLVAGLPYASTQ
jgi:hypothetical protein